MEVPRIDPEAVLADLGELADRTGGSAGARRLCWTETWREARTLLAERLAELAAPIDSEEDEAGNLWARLKGADRSAPALAFGSHLDSVPAGGPLDGALGTLAALGVLRAWSDAGAVPPRDLVLIDFADEEGARFGRSLFGSSALAGTLDPAALSGLRDAGDIAIGTALAAQGVQLERAPEAHRRLDSIAAWLELHIEQGPVLDSESTSCAPVSGCAGVERLLLRFSGQASHAGTTPMEVRRDAGLAAAATALAVERIATRQGGVGTSGSLALQPGVVTAVAGGAELTVDLRHAAAGPLEAMRAEALAAAERAAGRRGCELDVELLQQIAPSPFDPDLVAAAGRACAAVGGRSEPLLSGALHDAAEMAHVVPTAMVFCASIDGISHAKEERSSGDDLRAAIVAFGALTGDVLAQLDRGFIADNH